MMGWSLRVRWWWVAMMRWTLRVRWWSVDTGETVVYSFQVEYTWEGAHDEVGYSCREKVVIDHDVAEYTWVLVEGAHDAEESSWEMGENNHVAVGGTGDHDEVEYTLPAVDGDADDWVVLEVVDSLGVEVGSKNMVEDYNHHIDFVLLSLLHVLLSLAKCRDSKLGIASSLY
ncbi:hypothetical protein Adt_39504 [Abeliophyllum distichum]|uniref:Uncharacterized protein n=1 Tax=Abeliophyllum distichum TaxID=126358 RepID=A0ABD1Q6Y8_9LAMI